MKNLTVEELMNMIEAASAELSRRTNHPCREVIVEDARETVAWLLEQKVEGIPVCHTPSALADYVPQWGDSVEFVTNFTKRTVVALVKFKGEVWARGIAKCDPEDVFNEDLGAVIALHRAFNLEVPEEFLHVPQPTELRVGQIVAHSEHSDALYQIDTLSDKPGNCTIVSCDFDDLIGKQAHGGDYSWATIVDDTDAY